MRKIKWLYLELPFSIEETSKILLGNQYTEEVGYGFLLSKVTKTEIQGRYIEKEFSRIVVQDPFGNDVVSSIVSYCIYKFSFNNKSRLLCLYNPPKVIEKFTKRMRNLLGFGFVLSDAIVNPLKWVLHLEEEIGKIDITRISSYGIKVEKVGLAKISVSGGSDIRGEFEKMVASFQYMIESIKFSCRREDFFFSGCLTRSAFFCGNISTPSDVINAIQNSLESSILWGKF